MTPPEPMLSSPAQRWPESGDWVLQPKGDGFRLLIEVRDDHVCARCHATGRALRRGWGT
jgi:hypothetical protein